MRFGAAASIVLRQKGVIMLAGNLTLVALFADFILQKSVMCQRLHDKFGPDLDQMPFQVSLRVCRHGQRRQSYYGVPL